MVLYAVSAVTHTHTYIHTIVAIEWRCMHLEWFCCCDWGRHGHGKIYVYIGNQLVVFISLHWEILSGKVHDICGHDSHFSSKKCLSLHRTNWYRCLYVLCHCSHNHHLITSYYGTDMIFGCDMAPVEWGIGPCIWTASLESVSRWRSAILAM